MTYYQVGKLDIDHSAKNNRPTSGGMKMFEETRENNYVKRYDSIFHVILHYTVSGKKRGQ